MAVSKRVRFEIFKRDRFTCQYCGKRPPDVVLEVDHVLPRCEGGTDDPANLTSACHACNRGKAGVPLQDVAPALDEMDYLEAVQEMLERRQSLKKSAAVARSTAAAESESLALIREWWRAEFGDDEIVTTPSLRMFLARLPLDEIREAVLSTALFSERCNGSQPRLWKYFCGACWAMVRQNEQKEGEG